MRIIKARYLSGVTIDLKDSIESLKWVLTNKAYLSSFYYETIDIKRNEINNQ